MWHSSSTRSQLHRHGLPGTHDPDARPINNYVRVIDCWPPPRVTRERQTISALGGSTTLSPGTFFQQVTAEQTDVSRPWAGSLEFYITPWGTARKAPAENDANREPQEGRLARSLHQILTLEPEGESALWREVCHQRLNRVPAEHRRKGSAPGWRKASLGDTCTSSPRTPAGRIGGRDGRP